MSLSFAAKLTGQINHQIIEVTGTGHVDPDLGVTDGTYEFKVPNGFDPMLLSAFLICGYPNATASINETPNIFLGKSYEYRRALQLRDGGELNQRATVTVRNNRIDSRFHLTGWIPAITGLTGVEPVVESWEPHGPGGIRGHFTIGWTTATGGLVVGNAFSTYQIDTDHQQNGLLHRFISMRTVLNKSKNKLREIQTEGAFTTLPTKLWIPDEKRRNEFEKSFSTAQV